MIAPLALGLLVILVLGILVVAFSPYPSAPKWMGVGIAVIALLLLLHAGPFH